MTDLTPVISGFDIAAYSSARLFHEYCGAHSHIIAPSPRGPINNSSILDVEYLEKGTFADEDRFIGELSRIGSELSGRKILIVNADEQVAFVSRRRTDLEGWFLPYSDPAVIDLANNKAAMARLITDTGLAAPARTVIDPARAVTWEFSALTFPIVIKPEDATELDSQWNLGLRKVLALATEDEARSTLERLSQAGVTARLIAQELIPGDDTTQWVVNGYVDREGRITACGSGRVLLGLHSPAYLGNAGLILVTPNEELIEQGKALVKAAGIRGAFSLDAKIDPRDGVAKWLDLNPRLGRGHYYLKVGGIDLAAAMIADMEGRWAPYQTNEREGIFAIIPASLANRRYLTDPALYKHVRRVRKRCRPVNPMLYEKDRSLKRSGFVLAHNLNQARRMRQTYPRPTETGF